MQNYDRRTWPMPARALALSLALVICGVPESFAGVVQQSQTADGVAPSPASNPMVTPAKDLPDNPGASQESNTTPAQQDQSRESSTATPAPQDQKQPANAQKEDQQEPAGAAAAQEGPTVGGAASRPAGMAIAPAKQHQSRSLLIKVGAIAAGAIALGTVYALSRGSPSRPPGTK